MGGDKCQEEQKNQVFVTNSVSISGHLFDVPFLFFTLRHFTNCLELDYGSHGTVVYCTMHYTLI
jgi:hypothetical protein